MDKAADHKPDIRGFAISVRGVQGDSALGNGPAKSQDFLLINQEKFAFPQSAEFVDFVVAASHGGGALIKFLVQRHGLLGAARQIAKTVKTAGGSAAAPAKKAPARKAAAKKVQVVKVGAPVKKPAAKRAAKPKA